MPARLVYAPKAYVFTKNAAGEVLNFTPYVTSGQVQRLVDQASTAWVGLRNPDKKFTIPSSPTFHPMDPITIFLERLKGFPVQVFTGYLDEVPYFQMYPGAIKLTATCTLKRLIYNYWDPALPYVNAFLQKFGWINNNGALTNVPALGNQANAGSGTLQDGSIGKLLWATLTDIGDWHDTNIWIENLPSGDQGIAARMATLMAQLALDEQNAATEFATFMETVVGSSSYGSGGGTGGAAGNGLTSGGNLTVEGQPITQAQLDIVNIALGEGVSLNAPKNAMIACIYAGMGESGLGSNPGTFSGTGGAQGVWQAEPGDYNNGRDTQGMAHAFYTGGKDFQAGGAIACANRGDAPWMIANEVEANSVWNSSRSDSYANRWPGGQAQGIAEATAIVNAYLASNGRLNVGNATSPPAAVTGGLTTPIASATNPFAATANNRATTQDGSSSVGSAISGTAGGTTVIDAMISGAATISNADYPYVWGGGHTSAGTPSTGTGGSTIGYDCSGSVAAVLAAAGLWTKGSPVPTDDGVIQQLLSQNIIAPGPGSDSPECTLYDNPGVHIFMRLNGQYWGTSDGSNGNASQPHGGAGWLHDSHSDAQTFNAYHVLPSILTRATTYQGPSGNATIPGSTDPSTGSAGNTSSTSILSQSKAEAFTAEIDFPSIADMTTALILGSAHKGLMHDQQLLPFIQQLTQASMRSFQSLPNGDFFAFYPDYFGETNHRKPYWYIRDIEIMNGGVNLSDLPLVTHEYAVGDNTYPVNNELINMLFSAGTITVFNAFLDPSAVGIGKSKQTGGMADVMTQVEAIEFVKRYGARPQVQNFPMVRSPLYEMFLAYQNFLLAWSNQFSTPFQFTFMPEVYPGGKVGFPDHGLQMYVQSVTHSWDYAEAGFTTDAVLSAPAAMAGDWPDLPDNMVQALVEPVRTSLQVNKTTGKNHQQNAQTVAGEVSGTGKSIASVNRSKVEQILGSL